MQEKRILIVEDEAAIREMVGYALTHNEFELQEASDAQEALNLMAERLPDLILLDWMLPGMSGLDLARRLRKEELTQKIPIIMLTARGEEMDRVKGLEVGADDYITKPFSTRELIARIRTILRRALAHEVDEAICVEGLSLDPKSHRVTAQEDLLEMGPTEFRLLHFFMRHPERVYSRGQLLDHVWGSNVYVEERTIDVHIRRLRKALTLHGYDRLVQTVRGVGYRFSSRG